MKEKDFQSKFNKWLARNPQTTSCAFELKLVKGRAMPFDAVKEHQIRNLRLAERALIYKIPDAGEAQKPFDCLYLNQAKGFVVVMFYKRGQQEFIIIPIETFIEEIKISDRKSLTPERAALIGNLEFLDETEAMRYKRRMTSLMTHQETSVLDKLLDTTA